MKLTKIYVVSGFLGAGKTSVLQHLLSFIPDMRGTVVMVNEFGQLGIDGQILEKPGLSLYQLVNGCVCCLLERDLVATIGRVLDSQKPERILLEASGIADAANLRRSLSGSSLRGTARIVKVTTVLDARMWDRRAALGALFHSQLAQADQILLNKVDLLESARMATVEKELRDQFPQAQVIATVNGGVPPDLFWEEAPAGEFRPAPSPALFSRETEADFVSCNLQSPLPVDEKAFTAFLQNPPAGLLRAKGQVLFTDNRRGLFDWVDGRLDWRDPLDSIEGSHVVLIGRGLDIEAARTGLNALLR